MRERREQGGGGWMWAIGLCIALAWCSTGKSGKDPAAAPRIAAATLDRVEEASEGSTDDSDDQPAAEEAEADDDEDPRATVTIRGGETYDGYDARREGLATGRYSGQHGCTQDCSGHDAGREWAAQHSITDENGCGGASWSFNEGCRSYAREQEVESVDEDTTF